MHRNSINSPSGQKTALIIVLPMTITHKGAKIVAIWQHDKRVFGTFTAHAQKRLFWSFRSKIWLRHSLRRLRFPIRQMHFHYRVTFKRCMMFLCYHVTWPCDLDFWPWHYFIYTASHPRPTHQFWLSGGYRLLTYELLNLLTFPLAVTVTAHAPCHVIYHV